MSRRDDLDRIEAALDAAATVLEDFTPGRIDTTFKRGDDPLTAADLAVDKALREHLPLPDEGWLSEETRDSAERLSCDRVWVVDPIDGTREFVEGIPEWCVSIGLIEDGQPVAGGILNPATGERIVGAVDMGVSVSGSGPIDCAGGSQLCVVASNSEVKRGEWARFDEQVNVVSCGSVAYKLGLVAAGRADATWTLVPKHEWDVAGGVALVLASGGWVSLPDGSRPSWNQPKPKFPGLIASTAVAAEGVRSLLLT